MLYSKKVKYNKLKLRVCIMPPALTIGILIFLLVFIIVTRTLIYKNLEAARDVPAFDHIRISENLQYNVDENIVLSALYNVINTSNPQYYFTLKDYLGMEGINLTREEANSVKDKLIDLEDIINYEGVRALSKMSLEGKKAAIYICEEIYGICGLKVDMNRKGEIIRVTNSQGHIFYSNIAEGGVKFHADALIITVIFVAILYSIYIIIVTRNHPFNKEVDYDEFDEERFA